MSVLCLDPQNRCSFAPSHRIRGQVACLRAYRASDSSQDAPRPPTHSQALVLTTCSLSHKRLSLIVQHLNIHPTSTKRNIKTQAAARSKSLGIRIRTNLRNRNAPPFRRSSSCPLRRPVIWEHPPRGLGQGYVGTRCRGQDRHLRTC